MENTTLAQTRYSRGAVILHWLIALLIIGNFVGAEIAEDLSKPDEAMVIGLHKATGILILALTLVRIFWRVTRKPPPLVETLKAWEAAVAKVTHGLFYFLMVTIPLAGWGMSSAADRPVNFYGLFEVPMLPVAQDKPTIGMFHEAHEVLAKVMLVLFILHVCAALKHQFVDRDGTMRRMVPWLK